MSRSCLLADGAVAHMLKRRPGLPQKRMEPILGCNKCATQTSVGGGVAKGDG